MTHRLEVSAAGRGGYPQSQKEGRAVGQTTDPRAAVANPAAPSTVDTARPFVLSDPSGYHSRTPERFSGEHRQPEVRPQTATPAVSPFQEAVVERIYDDPRGRPNTADSQARTSKFLCLIADGMDAEKAAREARIGPWRALRIVTEADFNDVVRAIRAGVVDHAAVVVEPQPDTLAA